MDTSNQLGFSDELLARRRKSSQMAAKLAQIEQLINWQPIYQKLSVIRPARPREVVLASL